MLGNPAKWCGRAEQSPPGFLRNRWLGVSRCASTTWTATPMPCYKLGLRFGRDDILKRLLASGRTGLYVAVEHEGEVEAGETFTLLSRDNHGVTVADITRVYAHEKGDVDTMQRLVQLPY